VGKGTDRLNVIEQLKELKRLREVTRHLWILGLSIQAALAIVLPVLVGVGFGWWLDGLLNSRPWITVLLTAVGIFAGPIIVYRWVTRRVEQRLKKEKGP
jgi:F0F1-type ATP synthase assembly protein I